ncbi:MAG: molybdenum cofactor guanylyltransferase [Actinomycetia bacterium]|nr:molybdenum cofactor guanylyltransferase [Actinomycetes bacterium]
MERHHPRPLEPVNGESDGRAFDGAVLAGGASRRMGTDKAFIPIGGIPMVERVAAALTEAGARRVVVVGGDGPRVADLGLDWVADPQPGLGPLAGLVTALTELVGPTVVLPCDLIQPDAFPIGRLVDTLVATPGADVALPVGAPDMPADVLFAAWRPTALEPARRLLTEGVRAPRALVAQLETVEVMGLGAEWRADADHPGDLPR